SLGSRVRFGDRTYTVVGVVKDVRERGIDAPQKPGMYPMIEQVNATGGAFLAVRTESDPLLMAKAASEAIWSVDKDQPISALRSMDTILESQVSNRNLQMTLLSIFAGLALLLASLGVYGLLSYLVTQRIREVGLRMALGASAPQVVWMFARQGVG